MSREVRELAAAARDEMARRGLANGVYFDYAWATTGEDSTTLDEAVRTCSVCTAGAVLAASFKSDAATVVTLSPYALDNTGRALMFELAKRICEMRGMDFEALCCDPPFIDDAGEIIYGWSDEDDRTTQQVVDLFDSIVNAPMTARELAAAAADEIERRGWRSGGLADWSQPKETCSVCALGGTGAAYFGDPEYGYGVEPGGGTWAEGGAKNYPEYRALLEEIAAGIPDVERAVEAYLAKDRITHPEITLEGVESLPLWNDRYAKHQDDPKAYVVRELRRFAESSPE